MSGVTSARVSTLVRDPASSRRAARERNLLLRSAMDPSSLRVGWSGGTDGLGAGTGAGTLPWLGRLVGPTAVAGFSLWCSESFGASEFLRENL